MKRKNLLFLIILAAGCISLCSCQEEASSGRMRQAQLVGNENLVLKKQLQEKDKQIAAKEAVIKNKETQIIELQKQLEQTEQKIEQIRQDAEKRQKIQADATATIQYQLEICQKELNAKPLAYPELEKKYEALYADLLEKWTACEAKLEKYESAGTDTNSPNK